MIVIVILPFLFVLLLLAAPTIEYALKWRSKVKRDFLTSRGTSHRTLIKKGIEAVDREISAFDDRHTLLTTRRRGLRQKKVHELERSLILHLVDQELDRISGIGSVLKDRILRNCFDGTFESLNRVQYVHGIGREKSSAVSRWARNMQLKLPQLLQDDFPGKDQIIQRYLLLDTPLEQQLTTIRLEMQDLEELRSKARTALQRLLPITIATFRKAYERDDDAEAATRYLIGVYPEWRRMPKWFKTLKEKYGTA